MYPHLPGTQARAGHAKDSTQPLRELAGMILFPALRSRRRRGGVRSGADGLAVLYVLHVRGAGDVWGVVTVRFL